MSEKRFNNRKATSKVTMSREAPNNAHNWEQVDAVGRLVVANMHACAHAVHSNEFQGDAHPESH